MRIEDYIPEGRGNGITRKDLERIVGTDRQARKMIEDAREHTAIINLQDGEGYYIPLPEERADVEHWYKAQKSRALRILKTLKGAERWLEENPAEQMKLEV